MRATARKLVSEGVRGLACYLEGGMQLPGPADPFGLVGTVVDRKYRVDRTVAEGGFGLVYAGHHLSLDVPVAIKVLKRPEVDPDAWQDLLGRFVQEAQTMAKVRHPAIVAVLDTGIAHVDASTLPWIVLEWLDGTTLHDDLDARRGRGGRVPREAMEIARPVIEALAEAHAAQIAHRDIKPSNVMLVTGRRGELLVRVLDFGVAKIIDGEARAVTGHTTTAGAFRAFSRGHAAPEQIAGARTGPWTDVHALGLLLTELLVDAPPYSDEPTEQHARAFDERRPTPGRFGVDVGPLEPVIARALALKPADRFADAGELLAALDGAVRAPAPDGLERASSVPVVRDEAAPVAARRRRAVAAWTAVGVATTAALATAAVIGARGKPSAPATEVASPPSAASAPPSPRPTVVVTSALEPAPPPATAVPDAPRQPARPPATRLVQPASPTAPRAPRPSAIRSAASGLPPYTPE